MFKSGLPVAPALALFLIKSSLVLSLIFAAYFAMQ
jgi:hypothetical protein